MLTMHPLMLLLLGCLLMPEIMIPLLLLGGIWVGALAVGKHVVMYVYSVSPGYTDGPVWLVAFATIVVFFACFGYFLAVLESPPRPSNRK